MAVVSTMPPWVQKQFAECLAAYAKSLKSRIPDASLGGDGPVIGIPLSERYVAEVAFMALERTPFEPDVEDRKPFGPYWSIMIHKASNKFFSAPPDESRVIVGKTRKLAWPRLSLEEVDALGGSAVR